MAFEVDVPERLEVEGIMDSLKDTRDPVRPIFDPMRRKLHVAVDA